MAYKELILTEETPHKKKKIKKLFEELETKATEETEKKTLKHIKKGLIALTALF